MGSLAYHPREAETLTLTSYSVLADGHLVVPLELPPVPVRRDGDTS